MRKRTPIKNYLQEIQLVTQRSLVVLVLMLILVALLIIRLGYLQLHQHTLYTTLSQKNSLDLIPIEPPRGLIFDRNGVLLAENLPVFSLDIIPYKVTNLPNALSQISKIIPLSDTDIALFQKQLKQHRRFDEIPLKLRLSEEEVAKFAEKIYQLPGFLIKARLIRHYPFNSSLGHVLGYIGRINVEELEEIDSTNYSATNYIGKQGIEKYYEEELHGTVGYEQVENDASGEPIRVLNQITPVPGKTLYLTLDSKLQSAAENALQGHRGAIVAIQPKTGQILAMVSEPSYDPNLFVTGISSQDYQTLQNSPEKPLYNRALRGLYSPASTVKPYIALEGLESGSTTPDFTLFDPGWYQLKNSQHRFHDWRFHGHGIVNLHKAIVSSCDTYFYDLATRLGIARIDKVLGEFGFGELSGIDLEDDLTGVVSSPAWKRKVKGQSWYPGDTLNSSIGQGFMQATPLQLAVGIAALANQGHHYAPYLLLGDQLPGKPFHPQPPSLLNKIKFSKKNWDFIVNAMQDVVTSREGTGRLHFHDAPYTVALKTGTAQVFKKKRYAAEDEFSNQDNLPERLRNHSLLIAFAPVENPKIALAIVVENSKLAATVAREVLDYYLLGPQPAKVVSATKNNERGSDVRS